MKRSIALAALVSVLACALLAPPAAAAPGLALHLEVTSMWAVPEPHEFTASGAAVDAGLVSATGLETTGPITVMPSPQGESFLILSMEKYWTYGGGTLTLKLVCTLNLATGFTEGNWEVLRGTGNCVGITGGGRLVGTPTPLRDGIVDVWDGRLRVQPVLAVEITVPTPLPATGSDPFYASGPAVVRGLLPATGFVSTGPITTSPSSYGDGYATLSMVKYFVCDGGTFDVSLTVTLKYETGDTWGRWRILNATGSCAGLRGSGGLIGTLIPSPYSVLDVYTGHLRK